MKFRDLKIGTKQLIGFGLMLLTMAGSNFYSVNKMELLKSEIEEVSNNWLPRAIAISDINLNTSNLRRHQLQHAFTTDEASKKQHANEMISLMGKIEENLDTYEALKTESEGLNLYSGSARRLSCAQANARQHSAKRSGIQNARLTGFSPMASGIGNMNMMLVCPRVA